MSEYETNVPILTIGAVAKALKVHQRTLRIYDAEGILVPKRSSYNRRLYTLDDIEQGRFILFLTRNLAINLAGVKIILNLVQKQNLKPADYINYVKPFTNLTKKEQRNNIARLSGRGRPTVN